MASTRICSYGEGGVCRVCGAPLVTDVTACPTCHTPHHLDCWEYNGGCAVYGCDRVQLPSFHPEPRAVPEPRVETVDWRGTAPWVLAFSTVILLLPFGLPASVQFLVALAVGVKSYQHFSHQLLEEARAQLTELPDPEESLQLELKAVQRLVGGGTPHDLAQAYALFEQRHPRATFDPPIQRTIATDLIGAGHPVLGVEALDKVLRGGDPDPELADLRRRTLIPDVAFADEAVQGLPELRGPDSPRLVDCPGLVDHARGRRRGGEECLVSLLPRGWDRQHTPGVRSRFESTSTLVTGPIRIAGPFDEAGSPFELLWSQGSPVIPVAADELPILPEVESVRIVALNPKEARFVTETREVRVAWDAVELILLGRIGEEVETSSLEREDSFGARGTRSTTYVTKKSRETRYAPVLEVHVRESEGRFARLGIDRSNPEMYEYLGRRREVAHQTNIVLVTKDLVRFAPGARVSHGVVAMFSERLDVGTRFQGPEDFEEYVAWLRLTGQESVRTWWATYLEGVQGVNLR